MLDAMWLEVDFGIVGYEAVGVKDGGENGMYIVRFS